MLQYRDAYRFPCPLCGVSIVLPRQSPLGIFLGQQCQPTVEWPIKLLCILHGRVCVCSADNFHRDVAELPGQDQQMASLWQIDCACGHESCRRHSSIYTWWPGNVVSSDIVNAAIAAVPTIACTPEHDLVLKPEKMQAQVLPY